ncbi:hypothetical protein GCM10022384_10670 [Streptomyces marokkonensis]|uniref:Uncharacterized protein n=1 Tax=Streptomyces marokkonensis TaxID=324855 RepID=A0ABP7P4X7_9ACTN
MIVAAARSTTWAQVSTWSGLSRMPAPAISPSAPRIRTAQLGVRINEAAWTPPPAAMDKTIRACTPVAYWYDKR